MNYNITFLVILINTIMNKLYYYCKNGNLKKIKKLNLSLDDIRSYDNCAFRYASENGHLEVIKYLINKGLTLEDIRSLDNYAFRLASLNRHIEVIKYLIYKGLTLEDIRSYDNCAFKWASLFGYLEVIKLLIYNGLTLQDIRSQDNYALRNASEYGRIEVVKYLEDTIKELEAKEEHKKEWDYVCGEIEYKPDLGIKYFEHLEEFIK